MKEKPKAKNFKGKSANTRIAITIKKPSGTRKSFSLIRDEKFPDPKDKSKILRNQKTLEIPELDSINEAYAKKEIALDVAYQQVLDLKKKQLEKLHGPDTYASTIYHSDNLKIIKKLEEDVGYKNIRLTSYNNAMIDFKRIKDMLKGESIRIIPRARLEILVNDLPYRISVKNKVICRLNLVLKMAGRDFKISKRKNDQDEEISFINEDQLKLLLKEAGHTLGNKALIKDGITLLFYCGFREGELFGLSRNNYTQKDKTYNIREQQQRDLSKTKPKNDKSRQIPIPSEAIHSLERWLSYTKSDKEKYRQQLSRKVLEISKKIFTKKKHHISNHDLRHSFAIWCLSKGLSLTEVSFLLGNSLQVCVRHYTGFSLQKEALENIAKKLG